LPDGYQDRKRLAGLDGHLEHDPVASTEASDPPAAPEEEPTASTDGESPPADGDDSAFDEIMRILSGEESPAWRSEAEQAGQLAERLLRRNSIDEVRDLLRRGADPSIADEHGQTALMQAASPPVDRERFRLLAQAGADLEARRYDGLTGLHLSCAG